MTRRIFIGLTDVEAREGQIKKMLGSVTYKISNTEMQKILEMS